jgi:predicted transcriptional regulator
MAEAQTLYKLIVLSMLDRVDFPLTNAQISDFILTKEYTNYFTLQQVLAELVETDLAEENTVRNSTYYQMTEKGKETLNYFGHMVSAAIHEDMDKYFKDNAIALRDEMSVKADYYENNHEEYSVRLRVMEKDSALIDLTLSVPTEGQANSICDNWKKKNQKLYAYLMQELL